jgi:hypothetical protein
MKCTSIWLKSYFDNLYSLLSFQKNLSDFVVSCKLSDIEKMIIEIPVKDNNIDQYNNLAYYLAKTKNGNQFAHHYIKRNN